MFVLKPKSQPVTLYGEGGKTPPGSAREPLAAGAQQLQQKSQNGPDSPRNGRCMTRVRLPHRTHGDVPTAER